MFDESLFFIFVTCSLPVFAFALDIADYIKRNMRKNKQRRIERYLKYRKKYNT